MNNIDQTSILAVHPPRLKPTKFSSDIDLDLGNRDAALALLKHHPAGIMRGSELVKHNSGVYVTAVPTDPYTGICSIDYRAAESRGYVKLDFLNVNIYSHIKNEEHLLALMNKEPDWARLYDPDFCAKLIHIGNHYQTLIAMPEPVNSIPRLAMFMAVIRPAKRHLIGKTWKEVAATVWDAPTDGSYAFKHSHSVSYAHLVVVHCNLLCEQEQI